MSPKLLNPHYQRRYAVIDRQRLKWIVVSTIASLCAASWLAVGVGLIVRPSLHAWTGIVTAAAVSTEMLFWAVAGALGVTVIQARHRIWARIVNPLRKHH
jgi:hypothetical protein